MDKVKIGIIGAGGIALNHIRAYRNNPAIEIAALCDINIQAAKIKAEEFNIENVYADYSTMLTRDDIKAVSIVTPNFTHHDITISALNAGKNVLCEKPPGLNAKEAISMIDCSRKNSKLLMFGFEGRFAEKIQYTRECSQKGLFGNIYYVKAGYIRRCGNPGGWFATKELSGGGPLIDLGVHIIDLSMYIMGNPKPKAVFASTYKKFGERTNLKGINWYRTANYAKSKFDTEDLAIAMVKFDCGSTLFVETSFDIHVKDFEEKVNIDIFGDKAGARVEPGYEIFREENDYLIDYKPVFYDDSLNWDNCLDTEINHFIDCIQNQTCSISPAEDSISVMKIVDAIYESANTGVSVEVS